MPENNWSAIGGKEREKRSEVVEKGVLTCVSRQSGKTCVSIHGLSVLRPVDSQTLLLSPTPRNWSPAPVITRMASSREKGGTWGSRKALRPAVLNLY